MFFYWGGQKLSYLRYLTIYSFCKFNPDWEVILYTPKKLFNEIKWNSREQTGEYVGEDYLPECYKLPITVKQFDMKTINRSNNMPEVHKSDILRNYLIYKYGGFWSDMDILYIKPIDIPLDKDICCLSPCKSYHSIGLLGGKKDSIMYNKLYMLSIVVHKTNEYQAFGRDLWSKVDTSECYNLPMSKVYSIASSDIDKIYEEGRLEDGAIGLHWFAGHPKARNWENIITPDNYDYPNLLCDTIKKVIR